MCASGEGNMKNQEEVASALLTTPVSSMYGASSGKIFSINTANFLEAIAALLLVVLIVFSTPLMPMMKLIAILLYGIPLLAFNIIGYHHEDLIRYFLGAVSCRNKGAIRTLAPPAQADIEDEETRNDKVAEVPVRRDIKESWLWKIAEKLEL